MKKLELILLIDDNEADNEYHQIVLERAKICNGLMSITDTLEALDYFENSLSNEDTNAYPLPELVFLDINMPGINGFEMLDQFREIPDPYNRKRKMKIFMLTGSLNPDDQIMATEKYGDLISGFRIKPLTETIILLIIQKHF